MKNNLTILKIGGNVVNHPQKLTQVLTDFAAIEGYKILVHGGGKKASNTLKSMGIEPKMINGRRITDKPTLEVVVMVYAGSINKNIVAQLQARNCAALGLTGADGNIILAHKRPVKEIDYGFVGDIDAVNGERIKGLLELGLVPVFCAITHDKKGQLLNTNADTIAATLGANLAAYFNTKVVYCFEKKGVLSDPKDDNSVIEHITPKKYEHYKKIGVITDGMIPKLDNAFFALKNQVESVIICGTDDIYKNQQGTLLTL